MVYVSIIQSPKKGYGEVVAREIRKLGCKVDLKTWSDFFPSPSVLKLPKWDVVWVRPPPFTSTRWFIINQLQIMGYKLVNNPMSIVKTTNKFLGTVVASSVMKTPKTYLILTKRNLETVVKKIGFPIVVKPVFSSMGRGVEKISSKKELRNYLKMVDERELTRSPILAQEFIEYEKLIRVVMVGNKVIDAAYDFPKDDWKCSVCVNPNVIPYRINKKLRRIALKVKKATGQEISMLDVFEVDGEYVFNEINNACDLGPMQKATGVNHAKEIAKYLCKGIVLS